MSVCATSLVPAPVQWHRSVLCKLGFSPSADGYRRDGILLKPAGAGWILSESWPEGRDPLGELDHPGLWRFLRHHDQDLRVFSLPAVVFAGPAAEDQGCEAGPCLDQTLPAFENAIAWALATAAGMAPAGWEPPTAATIDSWARAGLLDVQQGTVLRRIRVIRSANTFALRVPLADALPPDLPVIRRQWLRRVLLDAQGRWSLVRTGITPSGAVCAGVDLTGVPEEFASHLFLSGVESLRWVAARLAETVEFLAFSDSGTEAITLRRPN